MHRPIWAPRATWRRQGSTPARAEPLHYVGTQLVTDRIGIPIRGAQQPLHPIWRHLAGGLGQRPAITLHLLGLVGWARRRSPLGLGAGDLGWGVGVGARERTRLLR